MQALAGFIMRGRSQAVIVAAVSTVLSVFLAPLSYVGAASIALVALRRGPTEGALVMGGAGLASGVLMWLLLGTPMLVLVLLLMLWLPVWLLALLLRQSASQSLVLAVAGAMGLLVILVAHAFFGSSQIEMWWRELLEKTVVPLLEQRGVRVEPSALGVAARMMNGLAVALTILGVLLCVYLGRWWQALLYNPGKFGPEFRALRLDRLIAIGTVALLVALWVAGNALGNLALDLIVLAVIVYMIQGLAVVHALVVARGASVAWLVALYLVLLLLLPLNFYAMTALGAVGLVDAFVNFRARFSS